MYGMDTNNVKKTKYYSEKAEQGKRYVLFLSLFLLCSCESTEPVVLPTETVPIGTQAGNLLGSNQNTATEQDEKLEVHFIDVGQGDAILIRFGEHAMQVDFGNNDKGTLVQSYLEKQGITSLDYAIGTHPDADHIGGMDVILYYTTTHKEWENRIRYLCQIKQAIQQLIGMYFKFVKIKIIRLKCRKRERSIRLEMPVFRLFVRLRTDMVIPIVIRLEFV